MCWFVHVCAWFLDPSYTCKHMQGVLISENLCTIALPFCHNYVAVACAYTLTYSLLSPVVALVIRLVQARWFRAGA